MEEKLKAVAYIRVSTKEQANNGLGLAGQKAAILRLAKEKGLSVSKFYEDKGLSGSLKERPGLNELLSDIQADHIGTCLVYSLDRLARNLAISIFVEQEFRKHGVNLCTCLEASFDLDDPFQKYMKHSREGIAELEADLARLRTASALRLKALRGEYPAGTPPTGFRWEGESPHRALVLCQKEAKIVKDIFRSYLELKSLGKVQRKLSSQFTRQGLANILKNRFYLGKWERLGITGRVDRIIDPRVFNKVQALLEKNRKR